jgi:nitrite reductase (NO-forming)/hydroxylamine reductase
MVAANASNKIAVVDTKEDKLAALVDVGKIPHPGRGANFVHPKFGPVWATSTSATSSSPDRHRPGQAQGTGLEGGADAQGPGRRLAVHQDASEIDQPVGRHTAQSGSRRSASRLPCSTSRTWTRVLKGPADRRVGRSWRRWRQAHRAARVQQAGDEVWFSVWSAKDKNSALVVVDDKTRKLKAVIKDPELITPTGKFNVHNTQHDVY